MVNLVDAKWEGRQMYTNPKFGTVKFFDNKEGRQYGFIIPDKPKEAVKDVFFHRSSGCRIFEFCLGRLEFKTNAKIARDPRRGERLAYVVVRHKNGLIAFCWNYEDEWKKAESLIASRPWPRCCLCRLVRLEKQPDLTIQPSVIWEGYEPLIWEAIFKGQMSFFQSMPSWYEDIWFEEQRVGGWVRMRNPFDPNHPNYDKPLVISEYQRGILQRFEEARLATAGIK